jgi:hypothetical protein
MDPAGHGRHGRVPASAARGDFRQRVASRGTSRGRRHLRRAAAKFLGMVGENIELGLFFLDCEGDAHGNLKVDRQNWTDQVYSRNNTVLLGN